MQIGVAYFILVDKILPIFRVKPEITFVVLDNMTILVAYYSPYCPDLSFPEFYFNWIIIIVLEKYD